MDVVEEADAVVPAEDSKAKEAADEEEEEATEEEMVVKDQIEP